MTGYGTQAVATRLDGDLLADVIERTLAAALNTVGTSDGGHLELVVDGRVAGTLEVCTDLGEAAGVECAAALIERQAAGDCDVWELRLWCRDDDVAADILLAEWHCPS